MRDETDSTTRGRRIWIGALFFAGIALTIASIAWRLRPKPESVTAPTVAPSEREVRSVDATPIEETHAAKNLIEEDDHRYFVRSWSFALDHTEMRIEDVGMTSSLEPILERSHAALVINGGFFDPSGKPVGLVLSDGHLLSKLAPSLSGGVLVERGGRASLFAAEGFTLPDDSQFAIQCRPRLVVDGIANVKSDDKKRSERTALCLRDGGHTVEVDLIRDSEDGSMPGPSLLALSRYLADIGCESALNLDGGPSSGAAWRKSNSTEVLPPRAPIRHAVVFRDRR